MNRGKRTTKALNTLGNAYLHLRDLSVAEWDNKDEYFALLDAGDILRSASRK